LPISFSGATTPEHAAMVSPAEMTAIAFRRNFEVMFITRDSLQSHTQSKAAVPKNMTSLSDRPLEKLNVIESLV
jgi:hypothetical protein